MEEHFKKVFNHYQDFYKGQELQIPFNMKKLFSHDMPNDLAKMLNLDNQKYLVYGSTGKGNLTELPWLAILDREISESAQVGFYVVFLFQKDMEGVYLSLNQGTKNFREKFKNHKPIKKMNEVVSKINEKVEFDSIEGKVEKVDLKSNIQNSKAYAAANIQAKYYDKNNLPDEQNLMLDLEIMLKNLEKIKKFIGSRSLDDVIDDLIFQDELSDVKFQEEILISPPAQTPIEPRLPAKKKRGTSTKEKYPRDSKIAKEALVIADYLCEVDPNHLTFTSPITKRNFVEAHHLIPMGFQADNKYSLDVPGNIISLCPNCHREIHHGTSESKKKLIASLYQKRKELLMKFGIENEIKKVFKMYSI